VEVEGREKEVEVEGRRRVARLAFDQARSNERTRETGNDPRKGPWWTE
jgi:hypothetical protein